MTSLDRAYGQAAKIAKNNVKKLDDINKKYCKGKKIIPIEEWHKINSGKIEDDTLKYIPDEYDEYLFIFPYTRNESVLVAREQWWNDYEEYFKKIKDPVYGRSCCKTCPFVTHQYSFGLEKIIITYLEKNLENFKPDCGIVNLFNCPYGPDNSKELFFLGRICDVVNGALRYCWSMTEKNQVAHYIDFLHDGVVDLAYSPTDSRAHFNPNQLWPQLRGLKVPKIPLYTLQDVYNVLINPDMMKLLLQEYLDAIQTPEHKRDGMYPQISPKLVILLEKHILEFFDENKELIKLQDLVNPRGNNADEEEKYLQNKLLFEEKYKIDAPGYYKKIQVEKDSGVCIICNGHAKIHCNNCQSWICAGHWQQHGHDVHNYAVKYTDYFGQPVLEQTDSRL